jgi:GntR family transcriptional repressor for pyruvate dehydrogenase complex
MTGKRITYGYQQIAEYYAELIDNGTVKPGAQLPTTREVCATWQVTAPTVAKAWLLLKTKGLIEIRLGAGGGTFVAPRKASA